MADNPRLHEVTFENPDLPDGCAACLNCHKLLTHQQLTDLCPAAPAVEIIPCECQEHRCKPFPKQTVRYRVRVGTDPQGVVMLCAHCYTRGHMGDYELAYSTDQRRAKKAVWR